MNRTIIKIIVKLKFLILVLCKQNFCLSAIPVIKKMGGSLCNI